MQPIPASARAVGAAWPRAHVKALDEIFSREEQKNPPPKASVGLTLGQPRRERVQECGNISEFFSLCRVTLSPAAEG